MNEVMETTQSPPTEPTYRFNRGDAVDKLMQRLFADYQRRLGSCNAEKDARLSELHQRFRDLAEYIAMAVPMGRKQAEALTCLETAWMFIEKAIMDDFDKLATYTQEEYDALFGIPPRPQQEL